MTGAHTSNSRQLLGQERRLASVQIQLLQRRCLAPISSRRLHVTTKMRTAPATPPPYSDYQSCSLPSGLEAGFFGSGLAARMSSRTDTMASLNSLGASTCPHPRYNWNRPSKAES